MVWWRFCAKRVIRLVLRVSFAIVCGFAVCSLGWVARVCLAGLGVVVGCFGVGFLVVWLLFWFCGLGLLGLGGKVCEMSGSKRWLMNLDKKLFHRKKEKDPP